jgi:hypothetical protein
MQSVEAIKIPEADTSSERERSTIDFPYTDLDNATEVVRGIHNAGGTACDYDQLAAQLNVEAKGGGFRLRVNGAKTYGLITYERGGRISLTELGRQLIDPHTEKVARMNAFLAVPLYLKVFEQFKGSPLPPQAGLERSIESMGVGPRVKDKARQVMMRSAKQAGFFDAASDRLVKPSIRSDQTPPADKPDGSQSDQQRSSAGGGGSGGGGNLEGFHPLIQGLLMTLPKTGEEWSVQDRFNWLNMASSIFKMVYKGHKQNEDVEIILKKMLPNGGTNSAT